MITGRVKHAAAAAGKGRMPTQVRRWPFFHIDCWYRGGVTQLERRRPAPPLAVRRFIEAGWLEGEQAGAAP